MARKETRAQVVARQRRTKLVQVRDISVTQVKGTGTKSKLGATAKALAEKRLKEKRARERRRKALQLKRPKRPLNKKA